MSQVTIRSRVERPLTFTLPHRPCCVARGVCLCAKGTPRSLMIAQPYGTLLNVDETDLRAPDFAIAIERRDVVVEAEKAPRAVDAGQAEIGTGTSDRRGRRSRG